ncbi:ABC transporter permease [Mucilaginibacter sp. OK098]|uniref:ABC transporter permease n=1 Tax=Mucilaginibacter sp. OK098 TaxID=1855297 RepID=UPI0009103D7C|nr:ABC transporter permease [Mucilaginibacter sp. OK098]SHN31864.1 ABC-type antimicrobial peptide transport system, permease component [Mucilaginibacter sp. OK098]
MLKNYFKTAFRSLTKNKMHSLLNITGLSAGMAVTLLIGLWINDELSFDKYHRNYNSIAQVLQNQTFSGETSTQPTIPMPLGEELRTTYGREFKKVVMSSGTGKHILASENNHFVKNGNYMQADAPSLFSLKMISGSGNGLKDPHTILLSHTVATAIFGDKDPINRLIKFDNTESLKVTGVYEDLPANTTLHDLQFIVPWELQGKAVADNIQNWNNNNWKIYVQMADGVDVDKASAKIKDSKYLKSDNAEKNFKPVIFLHPMRKWHLYAEFKSGVNVGGRIQYVWLFGAIGLFVLLLACINFMNLATAKSEKRAKEVGIRKAIGSRRGQLIYQFFSESLLMAFMAFALSLLLVVLLLPGFNEIAAANMNLPLKSPLFWAAGLGFTLVAGLIAGSYPAFYLSSFQPVKVLKGTYKAGRLATVPRKVLVVLQFTVSIAIIISTIVVFRQVQFAKDRPVGYHRDGLITVETLTSNIHTQFGAFQDDLIKTGAVSGVALSTTPVTESWNSQSNFDWEGRDKNGTQNFATVGISKEYGKTIGWQFTAGRDYRSETGGADGFCFVINESAAKMMGFKNPIGQIVHWYGYNFHIIGVIKDMVMNSPFTPVQPAVFFMNPGQMNVLNIKMKPGAAVNGALKKVAQVYAQYNPGQPFEYKFADDEYARKFNMEERVGKLAGFFAVLAIFISCLGIFGMASFIAEQRVKEIGVRKVLGASVFRLWQLLSKDFVLLVVISLLIASPLAFYLMHKWLQNYEYRAEISWWIFAAAGAGAILITILTVSFQAIKAAMANPVKSLRSE